MNSGADAPGINISIPTGHTVDTLVSQEDLVHGQAIANYTVTVLNTTTDQWQPVVGIHGQTVGSRVVDVIPSITGPATLRWACVASIPASTTVTLKSLMATKLVPPPGWQAKWALQTLYTPTLQDMTPCATRSSMGVATGPQPTAKATPRIPTVSAASSENRSSCAAYYHKSGARYAYVRDEHCCYQRQQPGMVQLFLLFSASNQDHLVASNASYSQGGQTYRHDST